MPSAEQWKVIPEWPAYAVSNVGRVKRVVPCPMPNGRGFKPMNVLKTDQDTSGYLRVCLYARNGIKRHMLVHRVVLTTFVNPPKSSEVANHLDGDKRNNRLSNLEWTTPSRNEQHAIKLGLKPVGDHHWSRLHPERVARGSRNGCAKLTEEIVGSIRRQYVRRYGNLTRLAKQYNVSVSVIWDVVNNNRWRHVKSHRW